MTYPQPTDKLGDLAVKIEELARWADARLPGTAIETLYSGNIQTNNTGDFALHFQTITNVQAIIQAVHPVSQSGVPSWQILTVPVMTVLRGSPADQIWVHVMGQTGAVYTNSWLNVVAYGWGTAK